jgi:hypothetical protein
MGNRQYPQRKRVRAAIKGGTITAVAARDRGRCHLCGRPVSQADRSRDHLRPRALGGYDQGKNYRLAHRICNSVRGHLPMAEVAAVLASLGESPRQDEVIVALKAAAADWAVEHPLPLDPGPKAHRLRRDERRAAARRTP